MNYTGSRTRAVSADAMTRTPCGCLVAMVLASTQPGCPECECDMGLRCRAVRAASPRGCARAVAPSSGVKVSIARCEWHADGPGGSSAPASAGAAPATITGWKLAKASLLGGTPTVAFTPGGSPVVLRHRELTSLNLSVQLSEMRPEGSKKTVTVTSKAKICPMALMQV